MGCADDPADSKEQVRTHELRLSLGSHQFEATRALPAGFEPYNSATLKIQEIQGYMAYWNQYKKPSAGWDALSCIFSTSGTDNIWTSRVALKPLSTDDLDDDHQTYYLYGFLPKENVNGGVSIAPYNSSYAKGAVMTFTGLNTVVGNDLCVFVGVQGYTGSVPDMSLRLGKFNYNPTDGNLIYLLVDRFYAGLKFSMTLDDKYAKLRDIKVKRVKLIPKVIETVDAKVTIAANNENPMSVVFQNPKGVEDPESATLYDGTDGDGMSLSTDNPVFMACVWPGTIINGDKVANTKFTLETTYDVYDKNENPDNNKPNKIRENETAQSTISLKYELAAGKLHTVNIKVNPTYLYVLSEPDLDSPTFQLEE